MIRTATLLALLAAPATAAEFEFCWIGANGYVLQGRMTVPDAALTLPLITEGDVTAFKIAGTQNGVSLGSWSLQDITPNTSWHLNFNPATMMFQTGGSTYTEFGQQWNAGGAVNDCGTPGFGFNSGNGGQDVCVDGVYRTESLIDTATPFPVYPAGEGSTCLDGPLLGQRHTPGVTTVTYP